ncbi:MAG: hypothetical protein HN534_01515 [Euryarchaeota archaeon]|jgi:ssDNA-binding replication factor A large subunit|nr:hypothetical protein [Euryarchaeota archaeon]MBT3653600.1 hypothetical protein [Euryarchaeota archaeon]MBT3757199.1 hypothetical protein [Euryarchaeota archaeon]MBT4050962.1 hypothetical protein [Euryarchaeota archaeon]MBT4346760.1 hypothetical protein [Euryarchaeota archaeon]|tara:strand:+ start:3880 stop:4257 length:378 start_codon:yes stop_codon:yes gene_type:complete
MTKRTILELEILNDAKNDEKPISRRTKRRIKVDRLKEDRPVSRIEITILRRYPPRMVSNRKWTGRVAAACGRDESGVVGLVLWDEQIDWVATGDRVRIENGWCKRRMGERVISTGRSGKLTVLSE